MGGTSKKPEKGKTTRDGGKKPLPKAVDDDGDEDGDMATPKRDRYGEERSTAVKSCVDAAEIYRSQSGGLLSSPSRCAPQPFFDSVPARFGSASKARAVIASGTALIQSLRTGVNSSILPA